VFLVNGSTGGGTAADPIIVSTVFNTNLAASKTAAADAASVIDNTNLYGTDKTGFIKNYLYPAFLFTCSEATDG
jgi:hypothetical protein